MGEMADWLEEQAFAAQAEADDWHGAYFCPAHPGQPHVVAQEVTVVTNFGEPQEQVSGMVTCRDCWRVGRVVFNGAADRSYAYIDWTGDSPA